MAPSSVISRSASAVSKGVRKLKKKVSKVIGRSRQSKSTSAVSEKAAESDADDKHNWTSPIYSFFDDNVETVTDRDGRKYQAFKCKAPRGCKGKSDFLGVKRFQTKANSNPHTDRSSTSNLKKHAK
ncbi:hypothetical protein DFH08DRAFT_951095 [Mycena albidolilacea]|uniref:Uncharacterized protein n=1 Tax=Mycena albidolilacea TaxID=1033008 RepID=A0AAD7AM74_9AGAR|nr:hypothetical protein DFH08DRAFT_951095 [Mycena albidolilacea]